MTDCPHDLEHMLAFGGFTEDQVIGLQTAEIVPGEYLGVLYRQKVGVGPEWVGDGVKGVFGLLYVRVRELQLIWKL